jgi:hypothetical protein
MSTGVRAEIQDATELGKPVYTVWPPSDPPQDDFEGLAIRGQTKTVDEMLELIKKSIIPYFLKSSKSQKE